jgi:hypothetical protein
MPARVVSIEDGNTLIVSVDKTKSRVRLIGINAPSQALSKQSRENLTALVRDKDVSVLLAQVQLQEGKHKLEKSPSGGWMSAWSKSVPVLPGSRKSSRSTKLLTILFST